LILQGCQDVDARDKRGHDDRGRHCLSTVMAGHSRPKDGVLSHAYVPAIHDFLCTFIRHAQLHPGHPRLN
jgi:hypothetical protein